MKEEITVIRNLKEFDKRYNIIVAVEEIDDATEKAYMQGGTISDESGSIKFVVWADSGRRYLYKDKTYLLKNITIYNYRGTLQVHVDKVSEIKSPEKDELKKRFKKLEKEKEEVAKQKYELHLKEKNIELEKNNINEHRSQTIESIKYLENKKAEIRHERILSIFVYMLFIVVIASGVFYIYDFTVKSIIPKVNDIIEVTFKNKNVLYKVVEDNKKENIVTLESMDKYKEKIEFERPMNLVKPKKEKNESLKKHVSSEKSKIYTYDLKKNKKPLQSNKKPAKIKREKKAGSKIRVSKKINSKVKKNDTKIKKKKNVIYINKENNDSILMNLPGIGPIRVKKLKELRPFIDLDDVLESKIGIGEYWAEDWRIAIASGTIVFD
jgi:hypothetical protein